MIIGIDVGGTRVRIGAVEKDRSVSLMKLYPTAEIFGKGTESFMPVLKNFISEYGSKPEAVSMSFPSILDRAKRRVISTANISFLQNIDMAEIIEKEIGVPAFLNHDVKSLLEYDIDHFGLETRDTEIVGFYIGTGFGTTFCIDGRFLKGKNGGAGEMGHMPYPGADGICGCGKKGCVETVAPGKRLEIIKAEYYPNESFADIFKNHSNDEIIVDFIEKMAVPVATAISVFDPDYIVLGGGVINTENFPKKLLESKIYEQVRKPLPAENLVYIYSPAGQENGVIGSAIYAEKELLKR